MDSDEWWEQEKLLFLLQRKFGEVNIYITSFLSFLFPCVNLPTKVSELGRVLVECMDEKSSGMSWYVIVLKPLFLL